MQFNRSTDLNKVILIAKVDRYGILGNHVQGSHGNRH